MSLNLNLLLAEKNKIILEQENRIFQLDRLLERCMIQIQNYRRREKRQSKDISRLNDEISNMKADYKQIKSRRKIFKTAVIKLSEDNSFKRSR